MRSRCICTIQPTACSVEWIYSFKCSAVDVSVFQNFTSNVGLSDSFATWGLKVYKWLNMVHLMANFWKLFDLYGDWSDFHCRKSSVKLLDHWNSCWVVSGWQEEPFTCLTSAWLQLQFYWLINVACSHLTYCEAGLICSQVNASYTLWFWLIWLDMTTGCVSYQNVSGN